MAISLSTVLLLGIILVVMTRNGKIKGFPALIAMLFGFFLASSGLAPSIHTFLDSIARTIQNVKI
ncbi:hypothetical protein ACIHFE_01190 [Streptomyces sp. NPDC052396]|uniref:hypothetical protein n=1 Tax=Streptomyces sp. NPDC052396 TaxID=3365689 RepID=UPI0037D48DD2